MGHTSKLTRRGQTTIPSQIRRALRAKPGDTLECAITEEGVLLRVKRSAVANVLEAYLGVFGLGEEQTEQAVIEAQRRARGWDEHDPEVFKAWTKE